MATRFKPFTGKLNSLELARLSQEEQKALHEFIAKNGRGWKGRLRHIWLTENGRDPVLRELRNFFGPSGLDRLTCS